MAYHKTAAGMAEIQNRQLGLRAPLRRLLIMIDGHSPLERFLPAFPGADVHALARELLALGLIADDTTANPVSHAPSPSAAADARAPTSGQESSLVGSTGVPLQPTVEQFLAARRAAVRFINDHLGPEGETFALRLERCADPDQLRSQVHHTKTILESLLGASTAQRFLDYVRAAATTAR